MHPATLIAIYITYLLPIIRPSQQLEVVSHNLTISTPWWRMINVPFERCHMKVEHLYAQVASTAKREENTASQSASYASIHRSNYPSLHGFHQPTRPLITIE